MRNGENQKPSERRSFYALSKATQTVNFIFQTKVALNSALAQLVSCWFSLPVVQPTSCFPFGFYPGHKIGNDIAVVGDEESGDE